MEHFQLSSRGGCARVRLACNLRLDARHARGAHLGLEVGLDETHADDELEALGHVAKAEVPQTTVPQVPLRASLAVRDRRRLRRLDRRRRARRHGGEVRGMPLEHVLLIVIDLVRPHDLPVLVDRYGVALKDNLAPLGHGTDGEQVDRDARHKKGVAERDDTAQRRREGDGAVAR